MPRTSAQSNSNVSTPIRRSARIQNVKSTVHNSKNSSGKRTASTGKLVKRIKRSAGSKSISKDDKTQESYRPKAASQKRKHSEAEEVTDFAPVASKVPRRSSSRTQSNKSSRKAKKELQIKDKKSSSDSRKSVSSDKRSSRRSAESAKTSQRATKKPTPAKKASRKSVKKTPAAVKGRAKTMTDVSTDKKVDHPKSENSDFDSFECEIAAAEERAMRKVEIDDGNSINEAEISPHTIDAKNEVSDVEMVTSDDKFEEAITSPHDEERSAVDGSVQESDRTAATTTTTAVIVEDIEIPEVTYDAKEEYADHDQKETTETISEDTSDKVDVSEEVVSHDIECEMEIPIMQFVSPSEDLPMIVEEKEKIDELEIPLESSTEAQDSSVIDEAVKEFDESAAAEKVISEEPLVAKEVENTISQNLSESESLSDPASNINGLFCSPHSGDGKVFGSETPSKKTEPNLPIHTKAEGYFVYSPGTTSENLNRDKTVFVFCCNCMDKNSSDVLKLLEVEADMYFFQNLDSESHDAIVTYVEKEKKLKRFSLLMENLYYSLIFDSSRLKIISNRCLTSAQLIDKVCDSLNDKDIVSIKDQITASSVSLLQIFSFSHIHTDMLINAGNLHIAANSEDICSLEVTMALKELLGGNDEQVILTGDFKIKPDSFLHEIIRGDATIASFENIENPTYIDCERGHVKLTELFGEKILLQSPFTEAASEIDKLRESDEMDIWTYGSKLKPCALWKSTDFSSQWTLIGLSIERRDQTE